MAVDCKNLKKPELCNFAGGAQQALEEQACELARHGVSIKPDAENRNYCSYSAGSELIAPVAFQPQGYTLFSLQASEHQAAANYIAISKGVLAETPVEFRASLLSTADASIRPEAVVLEYTIIVSASSGYAFSDDSYLQSLILQKVRDDYQLNEGEENSDVLIKIAYRANDEADQGQRKLTYYVALSRNVLSAEEQVRREGPPFLTQEYCPEWLLHAEKIEGTTILPGWTFIKKADEKYTAIPRSKITDPQELKTALEQSKFLQSVDPVRKLQSVTYQGLGGVVGLECPVFEVEILEIPKRADNCLAWSEKLPQTELEKKYQGKLTKFGDGYLIAQKGNSAFRYIGATEDKAALDAAKVEVAKRAKPKEGFEFEKVNIKQTLNDPVCAAYNLFPQYKAVERDEEVNSMRDDDLEKAIRLVDNETKKKNLREAGKIGEVKVVLKTDPETQKKQLIQIITETIHEDQQVPAQEVIFVVDRSGSMSDDAEYVSHNFEKVMTELRASSNENGLGLVIYSSNSEQDAGVDLLVPLQSELSDDEEESNMRQGLIYTAKNISGGLEYTFEAAWRALDEFERSGTPDSLKKIIVLTDEGTMEKELQLMPDGITAEKLHARAEKVGVEFTVVFITNSSTAQSDVPSKAKYLDYLEVIGVNPAEWSEEQRVHFWLSLLGSQSVDLQVKHYALQLLSEVSPQFRAQVARAINDAMHSYLRIVSGNYAIQALSKLHVPEARDVMLGFVPQALSYDETLPAFEISQLILALAEYRDAETREQLHALYSNQAIDNKRRAFALQVALLLNDDRIWDYMDEVFGAHFQLSDVYGIVPYLEKNGSDKAVAFLEKYASKSIVAHDALLRMGQKESDYEKMLNRATSEYNGKSWLVGIKKKYPEKYHDALMEYALSKVADLQRWMGTSLPDKDYNHYQDKIKEGIAEFGENRDKIIDKLINDYALPSNADKSRQENMLILLILLGGEKAMAFADQKVTPDDEGKYYSFVINTLSEYRFKKRIEKFKNDSTLARAALVSKDVMKQSAAAIALLRYHHDEDALEVAKQRLAGGISGGIELDAYVEALEDSQLPGALKLMIRLLDYHVSDEKILRTLGKIGTPAEISAISEFLHSPDDAIAQAAQDAIDAILAREELKEAE